MSGWQTLGRVPPRELVAARLELHHAAQLPAIGIAKSLLPHRDDDSHTALVWHDDRWLTGEIARANGARVALRPADLTLHCGAQKLPLFGKTRDEGLDFLRNALAPRGADPDAIALDFHYEMPEHPIASDGAAFSADHAPALAELARWYADAVTLLDEVAATRRGATPVLTWPHHFDVATLLELGKGDDGEARSIGVGLSPGDHNYAEPYLYVTPWPVPGPGELPALPHGSWRREGFFGAILTATELSGGDDAGQETRARAYLDAAVDAGFAILGVEDQPSGG